MNKIKATWIAKSDVNGDFVTENDGFVVFWPEGLGGGLDAWHLRAIADELDRRNKPWQDQLEQYFQSAESTGTNSGESGMTPSRSCTSSS